MKKINVDFLFPLVIMILLIFSLSGQLFNAIPPLGKLFDPFIGAVQNENEAALLSPRTPFHLPGVKDSVNIYFDDRKVPHIYAQNKQDAFFAQGYVTAYLRLWQMDFLSYTAAGRLSEIFGNGFIDHDRNQRRIGIPEAAKRSLQLIEADAETNEAVTAYTNGVNAYIQQLDYRTMPYEYKLLDYQPEAWTKVKSVLLMKYMASLLSGYEEDLNMTNLMLALGEDRFNQLFPDFIPPCTPIVTDSLHKANPDLVHLKKPSYLDYSFLSTGGVVPANTYNPKLGSNSWAVSGKKTKSGAPVLCCDPHLNLSLPAIWLEMQLTFPGTNVYGVSIPGTPAVIIGFNSDIAWGLTNGQDDVKDWYKLKITSDYTKYEMDGQWRDLDIRIEEIKRKGQKPVFDTIYYTVHGPIVSTKNYPGQQPQLMNFALRWELHNPSNEFAAFIGLNKAKNYQDFKTAIKQYASPVQNFTFAGKDNTIAIHHQGKLTAKWPGQGKFLLDGASSAHVYTRYIPDDSLPAVLNPACNYVLSANQHPTGNNYAYYYNGYFSENRANRIGELLKDSNKLDINSMMKMQLDNTVSFSANMLTALIQKLDKEKLNEAGKAALQELSTWQGAYELYDKNAVLYEQWWKLIKDYTWDEFRAWSFTSRIPADQILADLIVKDPGNMYFDKQITSVKETAGNIIQDAFNAAIVARNNLKKQGIITWGDQHRVYLSHMTRKAAFGKMGLPAAGFPDAINAMAAGWGPSWRMIVELGEKPRAYGVYAGGQSGNIGSQYYDNFVDAWNKGSYFPLTYYSSKEEARAQSKSQWIFQKP